MPNDLFSGTLVRLTAVDSRKLAEASVHWYRDTEFSRLTDGDPVRMYSAKGTQDWLDKQLAMNPPQQLIFEIHTLADDRLIGEVGLRDLRWTQGDSTVGISLGEREVWGKGFGTDAMQVILRYAFTELNLHRVSLDVFEYNLRAIRSYEKAGFKHEGRLRQFILREGQRWDMVFMGITRTRWLELHNGEQP